MAGDAAGAKAAAAQLARLDPNWRVEKHLSDGGSYPDDAAKLFVEGAREVGRANNTEGSVRQLDNLLSYLFGHGAKLSRKSLIFASPGVFAQCDDRLPNFGSVRHDRHHCCRHYDDRND